MPTHSAALPAVRLLPITALLILCGSAFAQGPYLDNLGREWRQLAGSTNKTWNQISSICPTDGATPCSGTLGGLNLSGWTWATESQVLELFSEFLPEILNDSSIGGAAYVLPGLGFFSAFKPTFEFYTTFGGYNYISGWTATAAGGQAATASVSAEYPVFYGSFDVGALASVDATSAYRGLWAFRQTPFHNLGQALPGTNGAALLKGSGSLAPGAPTNLQVQGGLPNAPAALILGLSQLYLPLLGGTLVPSPDSFIQPLTLNNFGSLTITAPWPAAFPSGASLYLQTWFLDAGAPQGVAATNAVRIDAP
jgi:hypothetical protein